MEKATTGRDGEGHHSSMTIELWSQPGKKAREQGEGGRGRNEEEEETRGEGVGHGRKERRKREGSRGSEGRKLGGDMAGEEAWRARWGGAHRRNNARMAVAGDKFKD